MWAGDPDGSSWPGLVGAQAAAPVAMRILRAVSPRSGTFPKPENEEYPLKLRSVCALSGQPPTAACPSVRMDYYIEGVTRTVPCSLHTIRQGQSAILWPAELEGRPGPDARGTLRKRSPLTISSPPVGAVYLSAPFAPQPIPMRTEGAVGRVWWYLDGKYLGEAGAGETFFHVLPDGEHTISVADSTGRSASTKVRARTPGKRQEKAPRL